ncbi:MAG: tetratricopeptide repeat protein [Chitinophagales bacterium]
MAENKTTTGQVEPQANQDLYQKVENTFLKYRNYIIGVLALIILGIGGYFGYKELYLKPKAQQAGKKIPFAQSLFATDSFQVALNGDGINDGFLQIADEYGMTKAGNLAKYYSGICYLKAKDFDNAIKYLEKFNPPTDELAGLTNLNLGHAYAEKEDYAKAIVFYKKAGEVSKSDYYSPLYYKIAGDLMVMQSDFKGAKEVFELIKREYPLSEQGANIDLDIAYTSAKLGE